MQTFKHDTHGLCFTIPGKDRNNCIKQFGYCLIEEIEYSRVIDNTTKNSFEF